MMEVKARLQVASKCYFGLMKHGSSKLLPPKIKYLIYKTSVRPVLTYGSETWAMGKQGENLLRSLERKVMWKIFGPVLENACWRRRKKSEICKLCDQHDVKFLNLSSLR
jgi:hypothetical protein